MAKDDLDELETRKQELEMELQQLHLELDDSLDKVRTDVRTSLDIKAFIRKYPLRLAGAAALVGFLFGKRGKSSKSRTKIKEKTSVSHKESPLVSELKKLASKKAISLASYFIEKKIQESKNKR